MKVDVKKLIRARRLKGWTVELLAHKVGRSANLVYKIEKGTRGGEATIFRIAKVLGVPMEDILLDDDAA